MITTKKQRTVFSKQKYNVILDGMLVGYTVKSRQADGTWPATWEVYRTTGRQIERLADADNVSHAATLIA